MTTAEILDELLFKQQVEGLRDVKPVERLSLAPLSGRVVPEFQRGDLREVIQRPYRIVCLLRGSLVVILRVVHGARDLLEVADQGPWEPEG